jgi:hypothetical protein
MFHVPWLHVKYIFNLVQNTLMYIKCIGILQIIIKLQPHLQLNEYKSLLLNEKPKKLVYTEGCTI